MPQCVGLSCRFSGRAGRVQAGFMESTRAASYLVPSARVPASDRIEGVSWCLHFDRPIDHRLVKEDRPACIEERNGCAGCPESTYRVRRLPDR